MVKVFSCCDAQIFPNLIFPHVMLILPENVLQAFFKASMKVMLEISQLQTTQIYILGCVFGKLLQPKFCYAINKEMVHNDSSQLQLHLAFFQSHGSHYNCILKIGMGVGDGYWEVCSFRQLYLLILQLQ